MEDVNKILNINLKNFNFYTVISITSILIGIAFYLYWVATYGVIYDVSIYSITVVFVIGGLLGLLLSLQEKD